MQRENFNRACEIEEEIRKYEKLKLQVDDTSLSVGIYTAGRVPVVSFPNNTDPSEEIGHRASQIFVESLQEQYASHINKLLREMLKL